VGSPTRSIREILVLPHTHHDVGYTDTPAQSEHLHREALSVGIDLALEDAGQGRAQMKWTVEVSRPLLRLLDCDPSAIHRIREAQGLGRLAVTAGYLNMTQLVGHGGYDRMLDHVEHLRAMGLTSSVVQHGDINGLPWGLVASMTRHQVPNLVMALNPDHGRPPATQPSLFWWRGADGSKVLVVLHSHYITATDWGMLDGDHPDEAAVADYLAGVDARDDYAFPFVVVHAAFDNRAPSKALAASVDSWNNAHPELPMTIVTVDEAVARYREHDLTTLPEYSGEWADWWAHGHGSSAAEVAIAREAGRLAAASQSIIGYANAAGLGLPKPEVRGQWYAQTFAAQNNREIVTTIETLHEQLCMFEEHTWGAAEAVRSPYSRFSKVHWHAKAGYAYSAYELAHGLSTQALGRVADASGPPPLYSTGRAAKEILLANPSSEVQEGLWRVPFDGGELEVHARLEPYQVAMHDALAESDFSVKAHQGPASLVLGPYQVMIDPSRGGVISIIADEVELVDGASGLPLAGLVDEVVVAGSEHPAVANRRMFHPSTPGPAFQHVVAAGPPTIVQRTGEGWSDVTYQVALGDVMTASVRLAVIGRAFHVEVTVDKRERYDMESVFVTFPFRVDHPRFLVETADAVFEAFSEQLPDTCRDWHSIQYAVGVSGEGRGVLWGSLDAPLVQLSGFHTGTWSRDRIAGNGHINSWLYNNLYFTNFRAAQGGQDVFRYVFEPTSRADRDDVRTLGRRLATPVITRALASALRVAELPHLLVQESDIEISDPEPTADGCARIRLSATSASRSVIHLGWSKGSVQVSDGMVGGLLREGHWQQWDVSNRGEITLILRTGEREIDGNDAVSP
jgi:hypothetical protein